MMIENRKLNVDAVIFDLDGTLIDSAPVYHRIIDTALARLDVPPVSKETLAEAMKDGGLNWDLVLPQSAKYSPEALKSKALGVIDEISGPMLRAELTLVSGAAEMLHQIDAKGMKLGLVTSTPNKNMVLKLAPLRKAGFDNLFKAVITSDDIRNKKPHAEPLVMCGRKLGVPADRCVYVGDTRVDIRAGKAAGMRTIGVLTGFDVYETLRNETPDAIIDSIVHLMEAIIQISVPSRI